MRTETRQEMTYNFSFNTEELLDFRFALEQAIRAITMLGAGLGDVEKDASLLFLKEISEHLNVLLPAPVFTE